MFDWLSKIVVVYSVSTLMVYVLLIDFSFFGALTDGGISTIIIAPLYI